MVICVDICCSKFTQKTSTRELCLSPLRTVSISIAISDGIETRSMIDVVMSALLYLRVVPHVEEPHIKLEICTKTFLLN